MTYDKKHDALYPGYATYSQVLPSVAAKYENVTDHNGEIIGVRAVEAAQPRVTEQAPHIRASKEIREAFENGAVIQSRAPGWDWEDDTRPDWTERGVQWRIKPGTPVPDTRQAAPEAPADDLDALVREYGNAPVTGPGRTRRIVMREIYHAAGKIFAACENESATQQAGAAEKVPCGECNGSGYTNGPCEDCNGKGYDWEPIGTPAATTASASGEVQRFDWTPTGMSLEENGLYTVYPAPAPSRDAAAALQKLCDQIDSMRRTMFLRPGTGQNYSYLVHEDVAAYIEEARAALARAPLPAQGEADGHYTHGDVTKAHAQGYELGLRQKDRVLPAQEGEQEGIRGPLTDAQRDECRTLYNNLKHLQSGGYYVADDVIRTAAGYGYMNGYRDFAAPAQAGEARDAELLNWLNEQPVDVIYLDDHTLIDVRGNDVRTAIRAAMSASQGKTDAS